MAAATAEKIEVVDDMTAETSPSQFIVPGFTIKQLLDAIPSDCYERSALHASVYVVQDLILIALFATATTYFPTLVQAAGLSGWSAKTLTFALWNAYWFWQGCAFVGIWINAHECGHQAFSTSKTINNSVGWVLHSAVGVPYQAWKISHGRHHAGCGHIARDEVYVPRTREQLGYPAFDETKENHEGTNVTSARRAELGEAIGDAPLYILGDLMIQQLFGWQAYLIRNASGQLNYPKGTTNHFNPDAVIFDKRHRSQIIMSNLGIAILIGSLATWGFFTNFKTVFCFYIMPYIWMNHFLVGITFLQHTDPLVPHYSNDTWTFAKGALATIDRNSMGFIGPWMFHGIMETHIAHHVSSKIPHYNAWKATAALKEFLGPHYQYRDTSFMLDLYRNYRDCFVDHGNQPLFFYKNRTGVAKATGAPSDVVVSDSGVDVGNLVDEKKK